MSISTIDWVNNRMRIIDQTKLPLEYKYIYCRNVQEVWDAIKMLKVRGAPAIGIAGALGVVVGAQGIKEKKAESFIEKLDSVIRYLALSRPTAVNLFWALERMRCTAHAVKNLEVPKIKSFLLEEALKILNEDRIICRKMGDFGARLTKNNGTYLTICNAGALATADYGTALGVFYKAKEKGKQIKVFSCETRPLLQGMRLTSWELHKSEVNVTVIADNTAAHLMCTQKIDAVFAGADRIAANGDTANKIGTFNLALVSNFHKVPFYIVAPQSTFDLTLKSGKNIPIEHRDKNEVLKLQGIATAPEGVNVYNPAFDITPHKLITAIVTEKGIIRPPFSENIKKALS